MTDPVALSALLGRRIDSSKCDEMAFRRDCHASDVDVIVRRIRDVAVSAKVAAEVHTECVIPDGQGFGVTYMSPLEHRALVAYAKKAQRDALRRRVGKEGA